MPNVSTLDLRTLHEINTYEVEFDAVEDGPGKIKQGQYTR